jgi:benzoyl-CoA reductase/2-hydroxyglutaryl-CoA dehydratase subunit BcrC/BadD/HgdB
LAKEQPPLTGRQLLDFKSIISGIPADLEQYEKALALYSNVDAVERGHRVRVLLTGVPLVHGAERVIELIEDSGGLVVCMENCTGVKPLLEDVDAGAPDILEAIARKYYHLPCSVMTPNDRRLESLRALAARFRPQCVVELVWQACLTYDVESCRVRQLAEDELGLPCLQITTDYSPADSARISIRLEALFETTQARSGRADCKSAATSPAAACRVQNAAPKPGAAPT